MKLQSVKCAFTSSSRVSEENIPVEGASVYWAANGFGTGYTDAEGKYFAGYSWPPCYGYNAMKSTIVRM